MSPWCRCARLSFPHRAFPKLSIFAEASIKTTLSLALKGQKRLSRDVDDITTKYYQKLFSKIQTIWSQTHAEILKMLKIHETGCCILYQLASFSFQKINSEFIEIC
jgi:hypothetical protein